MIAVSGAAGGQATPLLLGISLIVVSLVPAVRLLGVSDRLAFTGAGLLIALIWMLPWRVLEAVFGELAMDFSTWIAAGLMVVVGIVWVIVFNADLLLGVAAAVLGRIRALAPILRIAMAYPLAGRFRTGVTLAMFTLVVFTLVTGTVTSGSFINAAGDVERFGGGFDVRASGKALIDDLPAAIRREPSLDAGDHLVAASQSFLPLEARQLGSGRAAGPIRARPGRRLPRGDDLRARDAGARVPRTRTSGGPWRGGLDWPSSTRRSCRGATTSASPRFRPTSASAASSSRTPASSPFPSRWPTPHRRPAAPDRDRRALGRRAPRDGGALDLPAGPRGGLPGPGAAHDPLPHHGPRRGPDAAAARLESAFLARGMEAESMEEITDDALGASLTFNRLIQGFMALGLVVGVAALGVISARAVVERRQQIGVLRSIGFRRRMVQSAFLLESAFIALTAIVVGTALGLLLAFNIISDLCRQAESWENVTLVVLWANPAVIFAVVLAVALIATVCRAVRAPRTEPAEALRYQ